MDHELYLLHAQLKSYRGLVGRTCEYAEKILPRANWYISVSGGKDSAVLWHLINSVAGQPIPGGWGHYQFELEQWPDAENVVRSMATILNAPLYVIEMPAPLLRQTGQTRANWRRQFYEAWGTFSIKHGFTGHMMGLRRQESRSRARLLSGRKLYHRKYDDMLVCCPLAEWSGRDIWAYILENELPYLGIYNQLPDPEAARSDVFVGRMRQHGIMSQVRYANLEHYNELISAYCEFMSW